MQPYDKLRFEGKVQDALESVRKILGNTRQSNYSNSASRSYEDNYALVEVLTNTTLSSLSFCLEQLGISKKELITMTQWAKERSVTLRWQVASSSFCFLIDEG